MKMFSKSFREYRSSLFLCDSPFAVPEPVPKRRTRAALKAEPRPTRVTRKVEVSLETTTRRQTRKRKQSVSEDNDPKSTTVALRKRKAAATKDKEEAKTEKKKKTQTRKRKNKKADGRWRASIEIYNRSSRCRSRNTDSRTIALADDWSVETLFYSILDTWVEHSLTNVDEGNVFRFSSDRLSSIQ